LTIHQESLRHARRVLIEERRAAIKRITETGTYDPLGPFINLQTAIEAIDRAMIDEASIKDSAAGSP
jgi:hypothetical protein